MGLDMEEKHGQGKRRINEVAMNDVEILQILENFANEKILSSDKVSLEKEELSKEVDVYCISVPGSAFLIRSKGKISVTGNCHTDGMTKLFRIFVKENNHIWTDDLKAQLYEIAKKMVELEDGFINLAYGVMDGSEFKNPLMKEDMHTYIRYIADRRLIALGLKGIFKQKKNPLPWVDEMLVLSSHTNFFEQEESSYSKGALTGSWDDVWGAAKSS